MSYQREREEFIAAITREGVPYPVALVVLRNATTIQRCAELTCSSEAADRDRVPCPGSVAARQADGECLCDYDAKHDQHADVPRHEVREMRARQRIRQALEGYAIPVFGRDPRGACVKLQVPSGKTDDWGQTGICVPARGY